MVWQPHGAIPSKNSTFCILQPIEGWPNPLDVDWPNPHGEVVKYLIFVGICTPKPQGFTAPLCGQPLEANNGSPLRAREPTIVANVVGIQWWAALVASYLAPSRASKIAACCKLEALHTKVSLITANPVGSLARYPPDIDIWGYAGQDPLFTAPKDLRNLAAAVIPARIFLGLMQTTVKLE
jgi:hypothetical protein